MDKQQCIDKLPFFFNDLLRDKTYKEVLKDIKKCEQYYDEGVHKRENILSKEIIFQNKYVTHKVAYCSEIQEQRHMHTRRNHLLSQLIDSTFSEVDHRMEENAKYRYKLRLELWKNMSYWQRFDIWTDNGRRIALFAMPIFTMLSITSQMGKDPRWVFYPICGCLWSIFVPPMVTEVCQ